MKRIALLVAAATAAGILVTETEGSSAAIFFEQAVAAIEAFLDGRTPPRALNPDAPARRRAR